MDRQTLAQFRWVVLLGGATLFLGMAYFVVPFHYPGPLAVLIGTGIVATRGFSRKPSPANLGTGDDGLRDWRMAALAGWELPRLLRGGGRFSPPSPSTA